MTARSFFIALFLCLASLSACRKTDNPDAFSRVDALLQEASADASNQRYDAAMSKALDALDISIKSGNELARVKALSTIVGIDILTSRDADAWEKALEAESLAREEGFGEELSAILISKAKLCSYAEISPETGRNDEGLSYASEALKLAEEADAVEQQCEACYVIASLYINKNRWSNPIDTLLYRTAGEYLDRGQSLADVYDIPRLRRNGIMFRSRWFQQGDRNEEAIAYFSQVLSTLKESDHLTAASLYDRLVRLYTRTGKFQEALDAHDAYVYRMQEYQKQSNAEILQEMETRFQVQEKERTIERRGLELTIMVFALLLAAAIIALIAGYLGRLRRRAADLKRQSESKEQIIEFLAKDLRNPANEYASTLKDLSSQVGTLSGEQIRKRCIEIADEATGMNRDVAEYVSNILMERSRVISDIGLTRREIQIIKLSAEGLTAAEIASRTFLSVHTVNTHRQRIYAKMDVKNVSDMLRKAQSLGII
jgi:DNA-binding CsgD family transcriptional regulator